MSIDLKKFYKDKKIFITGHTGFKGSWLSIILNSFGAQLTGYAKDYTTEKDNFILSGMAERMTDIRGDILDASFLKKCLLNNDPEIVFHLAAQPLVRRSYENPTETYETNVLGTLNLLEAVRSSNTVKAVVIITTDKCYENKEWHWGYRECDALGGYDPYSSSKACTELLVNSYRKSFFQDTDVSIATVRAGNVIGGGDWSKDRIVPDCVKCLLTNQPILIRNENAVRPWQHVIEPLMGYLILGKEMYSSGKSFSSSFNFGPESSSFIPVSHIVDKIIENWGSGRWFSYNKEKQPHEATFLSLDISKAKHMLGWSPLWDINKTIEKTIEWYKNYESTSIYHLCVNQINEYMKDVHFHENTFNIATLKWQNGEI